MIKSTQTKARKKFWAVRFCFGSQGQDVKNTFRAMAFFLGRVGAPHQNGKLFMVFASDHHHGDGILLYHCPAEITTTGMVNVFGVYHRFTTTMVW
jgi:hypothetical protein